MEVAITQGNKTTIVVEWPNRMSTDSYRQATYFIVVVMMTMSFLGVSSNIINIHIFFRMKRRDSVTVSFLGLSMSDLMISIFNLINAVAGIFWAMEVHTGVYYFVVYPDIIMIFSSNLSSMFYTVTILITLFIAVVRCMCVLRPLQFKHIFTARRCVWFIVGCFLFAALNYLPVLSNTGVTTWTHSLTNQTRYVVWYSPYRAFITSIVFTLTRSILPLLVQLLLFICVIIMSYALKKAAKFRQNASSKSEDSVQEKDTQLSRKDSFVIRQVVMLCAVYLGCNFVSIGCSLAPIFSPDLRADTATVETHLIYYTLQFIVIIFEQINSSVNIFIYLQYNNRFREIFRGIFTIGYRSECDLVKGH